VQGYLQFKFVKPPSLNDVFVLTGCFKSSSWEFKNIKIAHSFAWEVIFDPQCRV